MLNIWPCMLAESSKRAFFKDFAKVVEPADVILEVLDARDPIATRSLDVERYIRKAGGEKRIVLLLNKIGAALLRCPVLLKRVLQLLDNQI